MSRSPQIILISGPNGWSILETSGLSLPRLIAEGVGDGGRRIHDVELWQNLWNLGHHS
jgi:hypothetical protein